MVYKQFQWKNISSGECGNMLCKPIFYSSKGFRQSTIFISPLIEKSMAIDSFDTQRLFYIAAFHHVSFVFRKQSAEFFFPTKAKKTTAI